MKNQKYILYTFAFLIGSIQNLYCQELLVNLSSPADQTLQVGFQSQNGTFNNTEFSAFWDNAVITISWPSAAVNGPGANLEISEPTNILGWLFAKQGDIFCEGNKCYQQFLVNQNFINQEFGEIETPVFRLSVVADQEGLTNFEVENTPPKDGADLAVNNSILGNRAIPGSMAGTILPVEFNFFNATAVNETSLLEWETLTETNNDFFDVERSADGRVFEKIGKVKGNGTTTETQNYEFIDREPFPGLNYYRLKQVDYNGDYEYSKVETVDFRTGTEGDVAIFPNPAVDYVNISLDRSYDGIRVTNSLGQLVEVLPAQLYESNQFRLDLTGYTPGVYFLEAKLGLEIVNKQFVKVK